MNCEICGKRAYSNLCVQHKPRTRVNPKGKSAHIYEEWRDAIARPYLVAHYGEVCAECGAGPPLDVDHIKNRGSHYNLRMSLANVQFLCRRCHIAKTNRVNEGKQYG